MESLDELRGRAVTMPIRFADVFRPMIRELPQQPRVFSDATIECVGCRTRRLQKEHPA